MKIKELIAELEQLDPEFDIMVRVPTGDYWDTVIARDIEAVDYEVVTWSERLRAYRILPPSQTEREIRSVIVLG